MNAFSLVKLSEVSLFVFDHFCGKKNGLFYGVGDSLMLWLKKGTLPFSGPVETLQITNHIAHLLPLAMPLPATAKNSLCSGWNQDTLLQLVSLATTSSQC